MTFKPLVIQSESNLSEDRAKLLIVVRLPFLPFPGTSLPDRVPAARVILRLRQKPMGAEAVRPLPARFDAAPPGAGYFALGSQIVGASLIAAPNLRNTEDEKWAIRQGRVPEDYKAKSARLACKDRDCVGGAKGQNGPPLAQHRHRSGNGERSAWRTSSTVREGLSSSTASPPHNHRRRQRRPRPRQRPSTSPPKSRRGLPPRRPSS